MSEEFKPFDWDPEKIRAGSIDLSKLKVGSIDATDLVPDPSFPWLFTTRQDLESRRLTTTARSTGSPSLASVPQNLSDQPLSQRASPARGRISRIARQLMGLLKRVNGSSGR